MWKIFASSKTPWIVIGLAVVLFVARNVGLEIVRRDIAALEKQSLHPIKRDARSATGYEFGQRSELFSPDGYHWVMQTQRMQADGDLRVRRADYDNQPEGRDVHWASGFRWWLGGMGWFIAAVTGDPAPVALEKAGVWASPALLLLVLAILVPVVWRWQGGLAAALLALGIVSAGPVGDLFSIADPDHHGLAAVSAFLTVLFLSMGGGGWLTGDDGRRARRYFIASGVAGGVGLWVSSATQVPVLIGVGLGVIGGVLWFGRKIPKGKEDAMVAPKLWRWWAMAGAATSVFFYLLEYFPSHFGMRLEVNHPFYAIAWLGAGELLFRTVRWLTGGGFAKPGAEQGLALAAVAGLALLPLTVWLAGDRTFWVGDRLLWALHRDYIVEFSSLFRRLVDVKPSSWLQTFSFLPVVAALLGWRVWQGGCGAAGRARLAVVVVPALVFFLLSLYQVRWAGISCMLWLVVLVVVLGALARGEVKLAMSRGYKIALWVLVAATVVPGLWRTVATSAALARGEKGFAKMSLRMGVLRDLARWLRSREGAAPVVVLGGPSSTTALIFHGGFKGLGTLYWENKEGLHAMVEIFSTTRDDVAGDLIRAHGITHIVVVSWDAFAEESARLAQGLRRGEKAPDNTFQARLSKGHGCPFWLRPVHYPAPELAGLKDDFVLVYEVVPEQSREEAALRYGQMMFDRGEPVNAEKFLGILVRHFPEFLPGWVALAQAQISLGRTEVLQASLGRIAALERVAADGLALDDRIGLATLLATMDDSEGMRRQIRRCVAMADEVSLRRLNANALQCFVVFARGTGEGATRPEIMRLAGELLPAEMLKQVPVANGIP